MGWVWAVGCTACFFGVVVGVGEQAKNSESAVRGGVGGAAFGHIWVVVWASLRLQRWGMGVGAGTWGWRGLGACAVCGVWVGRRGGFPKC